MNELTYINHAIGLLSEALTFHVANGCGLNEGRDCSCVPYRNELEAKMMHRQELEDANAEKVERDITQAREFAHGL